MTDKPRPPRPRRPNPFGDDPKPKAPRPIPIDGHKPTPSPGRNKFEGGKHPRVLANERLEKLRIALGDPDAIKRAQDKLPYEIAKVLAKFQTKQGRRLLVKFLLEELAGEEVALSKDTLAEIDFMLQEDATRTPDAKPIISVAQGRMLYDRLRRELQEGGA